LTSLHVGKNNIPEKEMRTIMAVAMRMDSMKILCEVPFKDKTLTELDVSEKNLGMEGALVVADYLDGNGAMTTLILKDNRLLNKESGAALGNMLKSNTVLTKLDVSDNAYYDNSSDSDEDDGLGFAQGLAIGIKENGALSTVIVDTFLLPIPDIKSKAELNFSDKGLGVEDLIIIAALIPSNVSRISFSHPCFALLISLSVTRGRYHR
jgi:hypothetical protein